MSWGGSLWEENETTLSWMDAFLLLYRRLRAGLNRLTPLQEEFDNSKNDTRSLTPVSCLHTEYLMRPSAGWVQAASLCSVGMFPVNT